MTRLKNIHPGEVLNEELLMPLGISAYRLSKDPVGKAVYQAKAALGQSAFNVAIVDAYNPPEVESIQTANQG